MKKIAIGFIGMALSFSLAAQETPRVLYTLNGTAKTISKVDLKTALVENDILTVGDVPNRIHAKGTMMYVVNSTPPGISVIDAATDQVTKNISLPEGSNPWDLEFIDETRVLVSGLIANGVYVYDVVTGDSLDFIATGVAPAGIQILDGKAYVACSGGWQNNYTPSTVSVIDLTTLTQVQSIDVLLNPQEIGLAPDGKLHVVCTGNYGDVGGNVVVVDPTAGENNTAAAIDTIALGGTPGDIAITSAGVAWLPDWGNGTNGFLYSYNTATGAILNDAGNPVLVGNGAIGVYYSAAENALFVPVFGEDFVQQLDVTTGAILNTFPVGDGVTDVVFYGGDNTTSVAPGETQPSAFVLQQNYPNPFNPQTQITFELARAAHVKLSIYNLRGQLVKTLLDTPFGRGIFSKIWDGKDAAGRDVASGQYMYELRAGDVRSMNKLMLLR